MEDMPFDSAIEAVTRLRGRLAKGNGVQVRTADERLLIKATCQAWFRSQKPHLACRVDADRISKLDQSFTNLLELAERATLRAKYLTSLKNVRAMLIEARSKAIASGDTPKWSEPDFAALIADTQMVEILRRRWRETVVCIGAPAPLAATVMMGGLLEALLLARVNSVPDKSVVFRARTAPKDSQGKTRALKEWGLKDYLDVAHEHGWIRQSAKDVGQVLRDYRNYVHPEKERAHGMVLDAADASMFLTVFCSIAEQVAASGRE